MFDPTIDVVGFVQLKGDGNDGYLTYFKNWNWKKRPKIGWNQNIVDG